MTKTKKTIPKVTKAPEVTGTEAKASKKTPVRPHAGRPEVPEEIKRRGVTHVIAPKTREILAEIKVATGLTTHGAVVDMLAEEWKTRNSAKLKKK